MPCCASCAPKCFVVWQLLVIVMELAEGGDLKELKPEAGCLLDEHTLLPVVVQVVVLLVRGLTVLLLLLDWACVALLA